MSRDEGAIPKLIVFILLLVLGIWFNLPSEINIGIMILKAMRPATQTLGNEMANSILEQQILFLHILGWVLIIVDILVIALLFRRKQYF